MTPEQQRALQVHLHIRNGLLILHTVLDKVSDEDIQLYIRINNKGSNVFPGQQYIRAYVDVVLREYIKARKAYHAASTAPQSN